ncbi:MAG: MBL fold metallo-hydrolase [Myxococcales bacterium]
MVRYRLHPGVSLAVLASAESEAAHHEDLGCSVQGPAGRQLRRAIEPLGRRADALGREAAMKQARELVRWLEDTPRYAELCAGKTKRLGRRRLREDVLFPDPKRFRAKVLHLRRDELGLDVPIRARDWPLVADLFAQLARGATERELSALAHANDTVDALLGDLSEAGWLVRAGKPLKLTAPGLLHVGHNATLVVTARARVLIDPYFRPESRFDAAYRPLQPFDLGPVDAIAITHSHGDHFHLGSLLQFPRDTRIYLPPVERENLYATDMAYRLQELGFTRVEPLRWWDARSIGDVELQALPFHGEQPTDSEGVYAGLRNVGSTWLVRGPGISAAFYADAGRDAWGDMRAVSRRVRRAGAVDYLFCGIRGFRLRPLFFGSTTLKNFLADVPLALLTEPQQLMADADEALDYGTLLGAKHVVPCADGGAPWFWREGMGPYYPGYPTAGAVHPPDLHAHENPDADPFPERLAEARRRRRDGPEALVLRPGDLLSSATGEPVPRRFKGFGWPFEEGR